MIAGGSHSSLRQTSLVLLDTSPTILAIPASNVRELTRISDWHEAIPDLLSAELPFQFAAQSPEWVMRIGSGNAWFDARVRGRVSIGYYSNADLVPMPHVGELGFSLFSNLVVVSGVPSAVVFDVAAILRVQQEMSHCHGDQESNC